MYNCQNICIKNKTFIYSKVLLRFLPNVEPLKVLEETKV